MVGQQHQLNGHEFEQNPGDGEGQGSLACCSSCGSKELDTTELLNNKTEIDFQTKKTNLWLLKGKGEYKLGAWD